MNLDRDTLVIEKGVRPRRPETCPGCGWRVSWPSVFVLVLLLISTGACTGDESSPAGPEPDLCGGSTGPLFSFVHMTDTHCLTTDVNLGKPPEDPFFKLGPIKINHWKDLVNSFDILGATVQLINDNIKPDFVVHTGDITDKGGLTDLKKSKELLDKLKAPYHACQGDHETKKTGSVYNYVKVFKDRYRSFDVKGWHFIMMGIFPTKDELTWLESDLSKNKDKRVVFFTHRLVVADPVVVQAFVVRGVPCLMPEAEKVKKLLAAHGDVAMVLSGHVHMNLEMKTRPAGMKDTAFLSTDALGETPHQFKVFRVYEDRVKVSLYTGLSAKNIKDGKWTSLKICDRLPCKPGIGH